MLLLPWVYATTSIAVPAILASAFPFSDAEQTLQSTLPPSLVTIDIKTICKLPSGTYIFGYDVAVKDEQGKAKYYGRVCRDLIKGGWVVSVYSYPKVEP